MPGTDGYHLLLACRFSDDLPWAMPGTGVVQDNATKACLGHHSTVACTQLLTSLATTKESTGETVERPQTRNNGSDNGRGFGDDDGNGDTCTWQQ